jgi:hypothetical protein
MPAQKSKLVQHAYEEGHKIYWKEAKVFQTEPNATHRKYKESAHISVRPSEQSTHLGHLSHLNSHYCRSQKATTVSLVMAYILKVH